MPVRQLQIGQQHAGSALCEAGAGVGECARGPHLVAGLGKRILQAPKCRRVVFHQQDRNGLIAQ